GKTPVVTTADHDSSAPGRVFRQKEEGHYVIRGAINPAICAHRCTGVEYPSHSSTGIETVEAAAFHIEIHRLVLTHRIQRSVSAQVCKKTAWRIHLHIENRGWKAVAPKHV